MSRVVERTLLFRGVREKSRKNTEGRKRKRGDRLVELGLVRGKHLGLRKESIKKLGGGESGDRGENKRTATISGKLNRTKGRKIRSKEDRMRLGGAKRT